MRCWLFFNRELAPEIPEAPEVLRFIETAKALDIELLVLKPGEFDLVVDSKVGWSAEARAPLPRNTSCVD